MKAVLRLLRRWRDASIFAAVRPPEPTKKASLHLEELEPRHMPSAPGSLHLGALAPAQTILSGHFAGNGELDVARLSQSGIWEVGVPNGQAFDMTSWGNWGGRSKWQAFEVGDFNGDGFTDIAGLNRAGHWIVGLSNGHHFNTEDWGYFGPAANWSKIVVGDFNGDGLADIAGFSRRGTWKVAESIGGGFGVISWAQWGPAYHWAWVGIGDFNGDGMSDVVGLTVTGRWTIGLSTGTQFASSDWGSFASGNYAVDVEVGDFNGDGRADVATLSWGGNWVVGLSEGGQFNPSGWTNWGSVGGWDDIETGDFNGDGMTDLVALGQNGTWTVALSQGDSFSTYTWARTGEKLPAGLHLQVGDLNGDGTSDVAVFLPNGTWLGAISDGSSSFAQIDMGIWPLGLDQFTYQRDQVPYAPGAPWSAQANRAFVDAQPAIELQEMDFNSPLTYSTYVENFYGVLRSWIHEADLDGITSDAALTPFLAQHMQSLYAQTRVALESVYPGQRQATYELLMAMNLAHGYYVYGPIPHYRGLSLDQTLHLRVGNCTQIADALAGLVQAEGIPARELGQVYNYQTPLGLFQASHVSVYANGLILDAEINVAFAVNLKALGQVSPAARLPALLDSQRVFGFYNWYLQPQVRLNQLARGQDGGILSFFYQYYFAGIGQGDTALTFVR
jgi:hypothetical protein